MRIFSLFLYKTLLFIDKAIPAITIMLVHDIFIICTSDLLILHSYFVILSLYLNKRFSFIDLAKASFVLL